MSRPRTSDTAPRPPAPLADTLADMRGRLDTWMRQTDDPLLAGPIAPIPQAVVSDPTDISPQDLWNRMDRPEGYG